MPPTEPPRKVDTYPRNEAVELAWQMNHEAKSRAMSTHYIAWPSGSHPPAGGRGGRI